MRDSTALYVGDAGGGSRVRVSSQGYNGDINSYNNQTIMYLDSPATTSSTTYTLYLKLTGGTIYLCQSGAVATLTLMEIAA